jgi:putative membrane protein insertion efficiency factor
MGHSHSPARHGGADRIFSADRRTPQPAAERAQLTAPPKNVHRRIDESTIIQSAEKRPGITARALLLLLRVYQTYLSPMNFSACRFYPSCSHYAGEAVQRFGARRGVWLALCRLARCQPFSRGGFDPVPDRVNEGPISSHSSATRATRGQELAQ